MGQRSAAEDVETRLPRAGWQAHTASVVVDPAWSSRLAGIVRTAGEEKVQHCITIMIPACRENRSGCSQLAAAILSGRAGSRLARDRILRASVTALELGLETVQAMRVIGNGRSDRRQASKSRKKFSEG
jgi:16S rRNA C1402 N4-methylase RsmH